MVLIDPEILTLVSSGATTLLGLMVTDSWTKAKDAAVQIFARSRPESIDTISNDLDFARSELITARKDGDDATEEDLIREWQSRLRRAVGNDSGAKSILQDFIGEYSSTATRGESGVTIKMQAEAKGRARVYQQGQGTQFNR